MLAVLLLLFCFVFFKQKTAYEMRISDWSSDVCSSDLEFALAEGDFIFAPERLNVAVTRARTKLVVLISRRLLDAVPADQEQMDKAELLREFVFNAVQKGESLLRDPSGGQVRVQVRLLGFDGPPEFEEFGAELGRAHV